jgi:hypothetical protein
MPSRWVTLILICCIVAYAMTYLSHWSYTAGSPSMQLEVTQ